MKYYETLYDEIYSIDDFSQEERAFYEEVCVFYERKPHWNEFSNYWSEKIFNLPIKKENLIGSPIYRICQDLESRLGIDQGYVRPVDYRDILSKIIYEKYRSRYKFCKEVGIDEALLSNVLNKKKHFSVKKLQEILKKAGYVLTIRESGKKTA